MSNGDRHRTRSAGSDATAGLETLGTAVAGVGGSLLRVATGAIDAVRPAAKPLHPRGQVWSGEMTRHGSRGPRSSVEWIDSTGTAPVLVRLSAAVGLPGGWPDIQGVAIRVLGADGPIDILMATTGSGRIGRFVLLPARSPDHRAHTTLLPYRAASGPLLLAALPVEERRLELSWASLGGPWTRFATVALHAVSPEEPSFDHILHPPPGLSHYAWVERLRLSSYRAARARRDEGP